MCLAVPMRVIESDGLTARCEARGQERQVSLFLMQHEEIAPGDHVMVQFGEAVGKMSAAEAEAAWALYDEMLAAEAERSAAAAAAGPARR
ncbi:HypC/HybG/HupF family hydrogenase formation chaperone [Acidimangrovimonas pyrenivorans]|uniref:HypC/HybG/HupF family hydrogenase formation chaperone n=1 Tax=Acidimangrovimonas pyrenivorans TaxID=2030798 RepID=A0ABV7AJS4_9RHOB